jgi:CubicO group peptidase (beta-lactamase class C family)
MVLAFAAFALAVQAHGTPLDTAKVSQAVLAEMLRTRAPGAAIGIVIGDRLVFAKGYGTASAERTDHVDATTVFRIGSYWKNLHPHIGRVTLQQLLTHRAGMIALPSAYGPSDEEALQRRVLAWNDTVLYAEPGEMYSYSSPGYWLVGAVLEQAERAKYAELVQRHVFDPLGMTASTFDPLVAFTRPLALDHRRNNEGAAFVVRPYPNDASTWPGGSAFSSVNDLSRVAIALLNDGRVAGKQALATSIAAMVMTQQTDNPASPCGYTFGLGICTRGADTIISHYGFRSGTGAVFTLVPSKRLAVIILANIGGAIFFQTERAVLDMFGVARDDNAPPAIGDIAPRDFARIAGTYVAGADTIRIFPQESKLVMRAFWPEPQPLRMGAADEVFVVDGQGNPTARFVLVQSGRNNWFLSDGLNAFRRIQSTVP